MIGDIHTHTHTHTVRHKVYWSYIVHYCLPVTVGFQWQIGGGHTGIFSEHFRREEDCVPEMSKSIIDIIKMPSGLSFMFSNVLIYNLY